MRPFLLLLALGLAACKDGGADSPVSDDSPADDSPAVVDADGDGYPLEQDCDDEDPAVHPGAAEVCDGLDNDCDGQPDDGVLLAFYADNDDDGYGAGEAQLLCEQPEHTSTNHLDCDDTDPRFHPQAEESDCTDPNDYNCDGSVGFADADQDGFPACQDCNDGAADVNPSAEEVCDDLDNDCDQQTDEGVTSTFYADSDQDNFGDAASSLSACEAPEGYTADATDCDDQDAAVNPAATEVCNGQDDDCDDLADDADADLDLSTATTWYTDADTDGYGDPSTASTTCAVPSGAVTTAEDCDDADGGVNPGVAEVCNEVDDDCDGAVDDDDPGIAADALWVWYADADSDGYGDAAASERACEQPSGYVADGTDCDDAEEEDHPGAREACDGVDNDCDGLTDDDDDSLDLTSALTWYADVDEDGYGAADDSVQACIQPSGFLLDATDCDDGAADVNRAATEACDGVDNDCDLGVDEGLTDPVYTLASTDPLGSCAGYDNVEMTISVCGCDDVVIAGAFADHSDGSEGQVTSVATTTNGFGLSWDDVAVGDFSDCDLDVATFVEATAAKSGGLLSVDVSLQLVAYDAGNVLGAGYTITDNGTRLTSDSDFEVPEDGSAELQSYTFTCDF